MKPQNHSIRKLALLAVAFLMVIGLNVLMSGIPAVGPIGGVVEDWSTHHVVYTDPGTAAEALAQGRIQQWYRTVTDPRYIMQQMRRNPMQRAMAAAPDFAARMALLRAPSEFSDAFRRPKPTPKGNLSKDWNVALGSSSASATSSFTGEPATSSSLTITGLGNTLVLQATSSTASTSCTFSGGTATVHFRRNATASTDAANLVNLINISGCGSTVGVSATNPGAPSDTVTITAATAGSAGNSITLLASSATFDLGWTTTTNLSGGTSASVGAGNFPAKFSFSGGMSASDIAVFNTSEPGSSTAATIIGLNNLYTTTPNVAFAYNTTTGDTVATSVVFDYYGDQIAFISTNGTHAYLNVLRFETGTGNGTAYGSPVTLTSSTSASTFTTCKGGSGACLYRLGFANAATDTNSSPYYDYATDRLWVGDNSGNIHEFTGVFEGSVAESGNPWGTTGATTVLTSPVYDGNTPGYVYVGAANGYMYAFTASTGTKYATSAALAGGLGIVDGPLLDVLNSVLYVTVGYDTSEDSGVTQVTTPGLGTVSEVYFGTGSATVPVYNGTFDNTHYTTGGTTGYISTCNFYSPNLYFNPIKISGFVAGTRTQYSSVTGDVYEEVASALVACSPQTEIASGGNDYMFMSVANSSYPTTTGCAAGNACLYSFIVGTYTATTATYTWTTAAAPNYGFQIPENTGGASSTSGIIVDNSASGGGSNIYFSTNATTNGAPCSNPATAGCAIQVSQAAP